MNAIIDAALGRSRMVLLLLTLIFIAGTLTYISIPKESNPDVPIPYVYVSMSLEGVAPEDAERLMARPVEQALRSIEGVKEMTARATQGFASVTLQFEAGFDKDQALRDVRLKVDEVRSKLPADMDEPSVNEINVALFPVVVVTLSGPVPERTLVAIARNLKDELKGAQGVLDVEIGGDREEMLEITVDPLKMDSYGISQDELALLFARNNRLVAAGTLDSGSGRFSVKLPGTLETLEDVQNLPVKVSGDVVVKFSDIAHITRAFKDANGYARLNGNPAVTLEIKKRIGENVIETIDRVRAIVEQQRQHWPPALQVNYSQDESEDIRNMLSELQNGVLLAVILVVCVLIAYLGWRTAALVAISVPGSFLIGIIVIAMLGFTVNVVVLFSLIMAVGMLVDDAIIVSEYADRKMCEGLPPAQAYREATKRMVWPIIASTATRLAAFLPLIFWPGIMGGFMKYLPITLIATLSASLVMAVIFIPVLGAIWGRADSHSREEQNRIAAAETGDLQTLTGGTGAYLRALSRAVDHPRKTFWIAVAMLVGIFVSYGFFGTGVEFFPSIEPRSALIKVHARGDLSVNEKDQLVREVEARILDIPDFKSITARSGSSFQQASADTIGIIQLEFKDWRLRRRADEVIAEVRQRTAQLPGIVLEVVKEEGGPGQGKPVQIELSSPVPESLAESNQRLGDAVAALRAGMQAVGGFTDVDDTRPLPGIEWQIGVNRAEAARFGADVVLAGNGVQMVTNGILLGKYRPEDADDEIDIRARFSAPYRNLDQLENLQIQTRSGLTPLANFIERRAAPRINAIQRTDARRTLRVEANIEPGKLPDTQIKLLQKYFAEHPYAPFSEGSVRFSFKGEQQDQAEAQSFLLNAFGLALFLMLAILVAQFNSFFQTLLILSAVAFSTAAVFLGLMLLRAPFGIVMGGLGVVALAGIIVNNNIILIDTYNHLRHGGMAAREAVLRTGVMRMRPVLLTAATAILGLLPMAFALTVDIIQREVLYNAPSAQWWVQLASAIAGGLAFATPITLILTPALLMWREESLEAKARKRRQAGAVNLSESPAH